MLVWLIVGNSRFGAANRCKLVAKPRERFGTDRIKSDKVVQLVRLSYVCSSGWYDLLQIIILRIQVVHRSCCNIMKQFGINWKKLASQVHNVILTPRRVCAQREFKFQNNLLTHKTQKIVFCNLTTNRTILFFRPTRHFYRGPHTCRLNGNRRRTLYVTP